MGEKGGEKGGGVGFYLDSRGLGEHLSSALSDTVEGASVSLVTEYKKFHRFLSGSLRPSDTSYHAPPPPE